MIYKVFANNKNTSPISVEFKGLSFHAKLTTRDNTPTLGEVESIEETDSGFSVEGDMGYMNVVEDNVHVDVAL